MYRHVAATRRHIRHGRRQTPRYGPARSGRVRRHILTVHIDNLGQVFIITD